MREAKDEHGEQHWCTEHLVHEDDHALEQIVERGSIETAKDALKVLVRAVSVGILVVRVDSSVVHLKLDKHHFVPASHPQIIEKIPKVRRVCQGKAHMSAHSRAPTAQILVDERLKYACRLPSSAPTVFEEH